MIHLNVLCFGLNNSKQLKFVKYVLIEFGDKKLINSTINNSYLVTEKIVDLREIVD